MVLLVIFLALTSYIFFLVKFFPFIFYWLGDLILGRLKRNNFFMFPFQNAHRLKWLKPLNRNFCSTFFMTNVFGSTGIYSSFVRPVAARKSFGILL